MSKVGRAPKSLLGMVVETQPWGGPSSYLPRPCKATIESFRAMALSFVDVVVAIAKFVAICQRISMTSLPITIHQALGVPLVYSIRTRHSKRLEPVSNSLCVSQSLFVSQFLFHSLCLFPPMCVPLPLSLTLFVCRTPCVFQFL